MESSGTKITKTFIFLLALLTLPAGTSVSAQINRTQAWDILRGNAGEKEMEKRVVAIRVLGLLGGDTQALELATRAVGDEKSEVRVAAATTLGELHAKSSVDSLRKMLSDEEPTVVIAAANALMTWKDPAAYDIYYEVLTGGRKTSKGLVSTQMKTLKDPKKMAALGVEEGIGFIPFAGIGLSAFKALRADDVSPVRAAAAKMLASDSDPASGNALVEAASDKNWIVRTAALEAIARRADPKLLSGVLSAMKDENTSVRCTAAATVIRLSNIAGKNSATDKPAAVTK